MYKKQYIQTYNIVYIENLFVNESKKCFYDKYCESYCGKYSRIIMFTIFVF